MSAGDPSPSSATTAAARGAARPLRALDRFVRAPLGLLYLGFLLVQAHTGMTLLYWLVAGWRALRPGAGAPREGTG